MQLERQAMGIYMKIGIFGGAFNPVHNGHLHLAKGYVKSLNLDKIIFVPTAVPPHKSADDLADFDDRLAMLELAAESFTNCEISTAENEREGKSYTYDTLKYFESLYPGSEFYLIIGADQFLTFDKWYKSNDILQMVTLCTAARKDDEERAKILDFSQKLDGLEKSKFFLLDEPVFKVSSSQIRQMIMSGQDISNLVPEKVKKYISKKGLYRV
ncbi:MAG: nicotinate (nicotinamide) nucleotide adenylyltransferase [Clostridiales bacterium]|nr:nicotinate (nicotinamide) nucleotide adenylyltransferase [Clostridiales bacterium]